MAEAEHAPLGMPFTFWDLVGMGRGQGKVLEVSALHPALPHTPQLLSSFLYSQSISLIFSFTLA